MGAWQSIVHAMRSWRTASVVLLSFSSGAPLGLVWIAIPYWMRKIDVPIWIVGLFTLAQAPWAFKMLWAPLMDRYRMPYLGARRGWMVLTQIALTVLTMAMGGLGNHPDTPWVVLAYACAIAFSSASQDIVLDGYAVEILRKEEQGAVVGGRIALYRAAMFVAGGLTISLAGAYSWPLVLVLLALTYLPMMFVTYRAPEPEKDYPEPKSIWEAVWNPFIGFLARNRALEILAFVIFYKLSDSLAGALVRPFLVDMHFNDYDAGVALATVGLAATLTGVFLGGFVTTAMGLGHSLWFFGFLQIFSNIGYVLIARMGSVDAIVTLLDRVVMYSATGFEAFTSGLGTGAFGVLLLRMTQKRFSVTQYALFSSLFALPRIFGGPIAGFTVFALSADDPGRLPRAWEIFFWGTILAGIPGMVLLQRFVPLGTREPHFAMGEITGKEPFTPINLWIRGGLGALMGFVISLICLVGLDVLKELRTQSFSELSWGEAVPRLVGELVRQMLHPSGVMDWTRLGGVISVSLIVGLIAAAVYAARHGAARALGELEEEA